MKNNHTQIEIKISDNIEVLVSARNINQIEILDLFSKTVKTNQNLKEHITSVISNTSALHRPVHEGDITFESISDFLKQNKKTPKKLKLKQFNKQFTKKIKSISGIYAMKYSLR